MLYVYVYCHMRIIKTMICSRAHTSHLLWQQNYDLIIIIMDFFSVHELCSYRRCKQERTWFLLYFSRGIQLCSYFILKTSLCASISHHCIFNDMVQNGIGCSIIAHHLIVWNLIITFFFTKRQDPLWCLHCFWATSSLSSFPFKIKQSR